jgi:hypothetical protein
MQDTDLLLINRSGVDYKGTFKALKSGVLDSHVIHSATAPTAATHPGITNGTIWVDTSQTPPVINVWDPTANGGAGGWEEAAGGVPKPIVPTPADVSAAPAFVSGTGTQADPFVLTPVTVASAGGAVTSAQTLTIRGKVGGIVSFTDSSATTNGARFAQAGGTVGAGGTWSGQLSYLDTPNTRADTTYTANLKIGTVYFRWVVTQQTLPPLVQATGTTVAGAAEVGAALTATPGTATGGTAPITYATKWQVSADGTSGWADIAGATGLSYTIQTGDKDKYLRALTTATDSTTPTAQTLALSSAATAKITTSPVVTLGWNADTDAYTRDPAANRIIDVHSRMRRCVLTDAGSVAYYLDADDSTKRAGDWLRLVETTELSTPYTGTHGAEVSNTALRGSAPAWAAGTYTKGQRVQQGGSVWECIAATTTATPAAGATAADLTGGAGQVMVEIPVFSVLHETAAAGSYMQHTLHLQKGVRTDGGYAVHPAFVKPDGSNRSFIYVGAYQGTGANGNGSASGVNNATNMTRAACRTACAGRGAGWHQLGFWEYNALQWLLFTEYQDMNSQKVLGNGAMEGNVYVVNTGLSNGRGNRSENKYTSGGSGADYVSYRGVENLYGRSWRWVDGLNLNGTVPYVCGDPSKWADDTATGYSALPAIPAGSGDYIRDIGAGVAFMPSSLVGGSATTFVGDSLYASTGWLVAAVGGHAGLGARVGALCSFFADASSYASPNFGNRICYSA